MPCIWFRYGDVYEVLLDARMQTPHLLEAISKLGPADRAKLDALIEAAYAHNYKYRQNACNISARSEPGTDWFE